MSSKGDVSNTTSQLNLLSMPTEVLYQIFQYLDRPSLHSLTIIHRATSTPAATLLYKKPTFRTTYRLAQFATTVATSRHYAEMVREFETPQSVMYPDNAGLAAWTEWKYRTIQTYAAEPPDRTNTNHPRANRFLKSYGEGVPLGIILHILAACTYLRKVTITIQAFEEDWEVLNTETPLPNSRRVFISDLPRSARPRNPNDTPIARDELIQQLAQLKDLEDLRYDDVLQNWLHFYPGVSTILAGCPKLKAGYFRARDKSYFGDREYLEHKIRKASTGKNIFRRGGGDGKRRLAKVHGPIPDSDA